MNQSKEQGDEEDKNSYNNYLMALATILSYTYIYEITVNLIIHLYWFPDL